MTSKLYHKLPPQLPRELSKVISGFRRQTRLWVGIGLLSKTFLIIGIVILLAFVFDRLVDVPGKWRTSLPILTGLLGACLLVKFLARVLERANYDQVARTLDQRSGDKRQSLQTVLDFSYDDRSSSFFVEASRQSTVQRWRESQPSSYVKKKKSLRMAFAAFFLAAVWLVLSQAPTFRMALLWKRFLDPKGNHMRPSSTWFEVEGLPEKPLRSGDDLLLKALLQGREVDQPKPLLKLVHSDGSVTRALEATPEGTWKVSLKNLKKDFAWYLFMGDARSKRYQVRVLPRPSVARTVVTYHYPRYSRIKTRTEVLKGRTITALEGTKVKIKATSNVPLSKATGSTDEENYRFRINRKNPTEAVLHLIISRNQKIRLDLLSDDGVPGKQELPYNIRSIADNLPSISIKSQIDGKSFYVTDSLEIEYRAQDDLGLSELQIIAQREGARGHEAKAIVDVDVENYGAKTVEGRVQLPIADLLSGNSNTIRLRMVARDTRDQEGSSRAVSLKIATNSFDRQLRFLLRSYNGSPHHNDPRRGLPTLEHHALRLKKLLSAKGKAMILIDALDGKEALGPKHQGLVKQISKELSGLSQPFRYGAYWFFDFQNALLLPRFRRFGEYAACWSNFAADSDRFPQQFEAALTSKDPRAKLQELERALGQSIGRQTRAVNRVQADYRCAVRELSGYLVSGLARDLADADEKAWSDPAFTVNCQAILREAKTYFENELKEEIPEATRQTIETSLQAEDPMTGLLDIVPALKKVTATLQSKAVGAVSERAADPSILREALLTVGGIDRDDLLPLAVGIYQLGDNILEDDILILQRSYQFLHLFTGQAGKFRPLGDRDGAARQRAETNFLLYQTLHRARSQSEQARLGLVSEKFKFGQPEFEDHWLGIRELRFALVEMRPALAGSALRKQYARFLERFSLFESWSVPEDLQPAQLAEILISFEEECGRLSEPMLPGVKAYLDALARDIRSRGQSLLSGIDSLRKAMKDEVARLEEKKDPRSLYPSLKMKVLLKAVQLAVLKTLDILELHSIYHVGDESGLSPVQVSHLLLAKVIREFEKRIEARAIHVFTEFRQVAFGSGLSIMARDKLQLKAWLGKIKDYQTLDQTLGAITQFVRSPGPQGLKDLMQKQNMSHQYRKEMEALIAALSVQKRLQDREEVLTDLVDDPDDSAGPWGEIFYSFYRIRESLREGGNPKDLKSQVPPLMATLKKFARLPKAARIGIQFLEDCTVLSETDAEGRDDLFTQSNTLLHDLKSLAIPRDKKITQHIAEFYGWMPAMDRGALLRAKIRSQQQILKDKQMVNRALAARVLELSGHRSDNLVWALGESELNRRKASLALDRVGLGGIALSGDALADLKIPRHLYLELKRARAGNMPMLFKDECYLYLNRILQEAR